MDAAQLKPGYELVFTVFDYYDGPRQGIANFEGRPHFYECIFSEAQDGYTDLFWLTPITSEVFEPAMEDWSIWRSWESAFHEGKAKLDTHPALPQDRARHVELRHMLDTALVTDPERSVCRKGLFENLGERSVPTGVLQCQQVRWTTPPHSQ